MSQTEVLTREEVEASPIPAPRNRARTGGNTGTRIISGTGSHGRLRGTPSPVLSRVPNISKSPKPPRTVVYPTGDGKTMGDRKRHVTCIGYAVNSGEIATAHLNRVWVSGNDFVYYQEGNPKARFSPDAYIALDVERRERDNFKIWEEGHAPSIVWEFTSKRTRKQDRVDKYELYERLGIREYVMFDPYGEYLKPRLQGYHLVDGRYQPMEPDEQGHLLSRETGIGMYVDAGVNLLRFVHPLTGEVILTREEAEAHTWDVVKRAERAEAERAEETARAEQETARANRAEDELAKIRAELERIRGG